MAVGFNSLAHSTSMSQSAYNKMNRTNREIDKTVRVLSSSFRINSASDDSAGLAISERMRGEISGLEEAISNMQDGMSMLQTAEGGLQGISSIVQRMRELAVRSASDTLTQSDRAAIQSEFGEIRQEIDRITNTTQYNKKKLLNGNASALWSSSDSDMHVILNGQINELNQSGDRVSAEGNYDISIKAKAGQSEIQKSELFLTHEEARYDTFIGVEGGNLYYDSDGNEITMREAVKNFGFASWIDPAPGTRDGTTYTFDIIDSQTKEKVTILTTIYSSDFKTPQGFVDFMNSPSTRANRNTLYGTGYEAYFNKDTGKLGIRSSHDFMINDSAGGFQRLFGGKPESDDDTFSSSTGDNTSIPQNTGSASSSYPTPQSRKLLINTSAIPPNVRAAGDTVTLNDGETRTLAGDYEKIIIADNATVNLTISNLTLNGDITIGQGSNLTLTLNGTNKLGTPTQTYGQNSITLSAGSSLTIQGNGSLNGLIKNTSGGTVTIDSGTITSRASSSNTAGIYNPEGATLIINGGSVTAQGGNYAAGIGGERDESAGTVVINDGTVRATGGNYAAGIGGGYITDEGRGKAITENAGSITINGGTVTGIGTGMGAGIGGGRHMSAGVININGGTVSGTSNSNGAGIGGGSGGSGGTINITGGTVTAISNGERGAGLGGGSSGGASHATAGTINISGGTVTARGGQQGAGIGVGIEGEGGTINISGGTIDAHGGINGAGIGGGRDNTGLDITISDGDITATGGLNGAGIGGGLNSDGGNITITGGRINAISGSGAASIGGGVNGAAGTLNIDNGLYFDDNTGRTKAFNELGRTGRIGAGQTIIFNTDVLESSKLISKYIPAHNIASGDLILRELANFYDENGNFILNEPKTITLIQGDGRTANVTLYADDTLDNVTGKLNNAIAYDLGQSKYVDDAMKFVTLVEGSTLASEAVDGTMIVRSAIAGEKGKIMFSGDENILNALSLNTIQEALENEFSITITNAHTNEILSNDIRTTGNRAAGVINQNIDIDFDVMTGISATWNDNSKNFTFTAHGYNSTVHISDNSLNIHSGTHEGESINVGIGDMSTRSLNLDTLDISSRESAAKSITVIDEAADKVSSQSAKVGALISRLERSISAASVMHENVSGAESKIRDADMAKEYMNFTKLNIMLNASQSVFSQANQTANNVLTLLR